MVVFLSGLLFRTTETPTPIHGPTEGGPESGVVGGSFDRGENSLQPGAGGPGTGEQKKQQMPGASSASLDA